MPSSRLDELLVETIDGQDLFEPGVEVGLTLREQAELAQYRKLIRALRTLRDDALVPSEGVVDEILAYLEDATERHAIRSILTRSTGRLPRRDRRGHGGGSGRCHRARQPFSPALPARRLTVRPDLPPDPERGPTGRCCYPFGVLGQ